jgi:hypothetical protein
LERGGGCLTNAVYIQLDATHGRKRECREGKKWEDANHDEGSPRSQRATQTRGPNEGTYLEQIHERARTIEEKDAVFTGGKQGISRYCC